MMPWWLFFVRRDVGVAPFAVVKRRQIVCFAELCLALEVRAKFGAKRRKRPGVKPSLFLCTEQGSALFFLRLDGSGDKFAEERMRVHGTGLEFGMELAAHEPRVIGQFHHFHKRSIG